jgi:hypothetical protein
MPMENFLKDLGVRYRSADISTEGAISYARDNSSAGILVRMLLARGVHHDIGIDEETFTIHSDAPEQ